MRKQSARAMVRLGIAFLVLLVLVRFVGLSEANLVGDDLAMGVSVVLIVVGAIFSR